MSIEFKDEIVELYDSLFDDYKDVHGLKSPN